MPITGSQKALMYAQSGVARSGATRSAYHSSRVFVSIAGTQYAYGRSSSTQKILIDSLTINETEGQNRNTCEFTAMGFTPTVGQDVIITLGSRNSLDRIFGGEILSVHQEYVGKPANQQYHVTVTEYTWLLDRRLVVKRYTSQSATAIATDLITSFTSGFTVVNVAAGLATVDEITFTNQTVTEALTNLAQRIGGYWYVDYRKDLHFFTTDTSGTAPTDLTSSHPTLTAFAVARDLSQIVTRVYVEGRGPQAFQDAAVGATSLALVDTTDFSSSGGIAVSGPQRITYTGLGLGYQPTLTQWVVRSGPTAARGWTGIAWAPSLSLFAAVASDATAQDIMTSPDGITWTTRTPPVNSAWSAVTWASSISLFAAVSSSGLVMTSPDGVTWTQRTAAAANAWRDICWSGSLFVAVSSNGVSRVMTSPDGITWTSRTAAAALQWQGVVWSPEKSLFVAVADSGPNSVMTSPDGTTWTQRTTATVYRTIAWSPTLSLFVIVGGSAGTAVLATSPDGITWTAGTAANGNSWENVIWASELRLFVAVSSDGASNTTDRIMASADGFSWTGYSEPAVGAWQGLAWAPSIARLTAIGIVTGAVAQIITNDVSTYATLTGIPASGAGSIVYAINAGDDVNTLVQVDDAAAQTALAALVGGDGIQEDYIQDRRLSRTEATARGTAWLALRSSTDASIAYKVRDKNTKIGRTITVNLPSPTSVSQSFKVQQVTMSDFSDNAAMFPTRSVGASSVRFSFEDLLRNALKK